MEEALAASELKVCYITLELPVLFAVETNESVTKAKMGPIPSLNALIAYPCDGDGRRALVVCVKRLIYANKQKTGGRPTKAIGYFIQRSEFTLSLSLSLSFSPIASR